MGSYLEQKIDLSEQTAEKWKLDHKIAMIVMDIEELLEDVCRYYDQVDRYVKSYVDDVVNGRIPYSFEENQKTKTLSRKWLNLARTSMEVIEKCNAEGYTVDCKHKLERCVAEAVKSEKNGFELYAMQMASSISIPHDFVAKSESLESWPAY